jgi:serine/threonine protein kinase
MKKIDFSHEQYYPLEELGRGGMGIVYKCNDLKLGHAVAVKVLGWNLSNDEIIRFHKEAKALAKLQHPNILGIRHFGHSDNDSLFLVMELLNGKSLAQLLDSEIILPFEDALNTFIQICDGLGHAHKKNILHRDIKPSNVFVERTASGDLKATITDFGLAKLLTEDQHQTKTGIALGTPAYMSPEQAAAKPVDERADIYSLGILMFEILAGTRPFDATTIPGLLMMQVNQPAPRLSDVVPDRNYPEEMEVILAKCLAKDPNDRYSNTKELREDLEQLKGLSQTTYASIDSSTGDSQAASNAARLDEFLRTGMQRSERQARKTTAVAFYGLIVLGVIVLTFSVQTISSSWIDTSKSWEHPEDGLNLTGQSKDKDMSSMNQAIIDKLKSEASEVSWVKCRGRGGGLNLLEIARNSRKSLKDNGTISAAYIDAEESDVTAKQLSTLIGLPILGLRLDHTSTDDATVRDVLSKLTKLKSLDLTGTKVTNACIKYLSANKELLVIELSGTVITDEALNLIGDLKALNCVSLGDCRKLTGATFGALKKIRRPFMLNVGNSNINLENLKILQDLPLTYLDVSHLALTDKDLAVISNIETLNVVILSKNPRVTPDGLFQLAKLKKLDRLGIYGCQQLTPAVMKRFDKLHPTPPIHIIEPANDDEE